MLDWIASPEAWIALASLISLEIVLGIDNIIFISILVGRLPEQQRDRARLIGLALAMVSRILLLLSLFWVMKLVTPLFSLFGHTVSGRDIILIIGGLFLLSKGTLEIHHSLEIEHSNEDATSQKATFGMILTQIAIIDVVFSLDSVITAIGMVQNVPIMIIAVLVSVAVMMCAAKAIGTFVDRNPTIKMLALSFLMMIGITLVAEGFGIQVPKAYIYFAMVFSLSVELLNIRVRRHTMSQPIKLSRFIEEKSNDAQTDVIKSNHLK